MSPRRRRNTVHGHGEWCVERRQALTFSAGLDLLSPAEDVVGREGDAKYVGRDEANLRGVESNITDENAVDAREEPSLPALLA